MFGIGGFELILCFLVVLLVFGPKKLPEVGRLIAKAMFTFREATKEVRRSMHDIQSEFETDIKDVRRTGEEIQRKMLSDEYSTCEDKAALDTSLTPDERMSDEELLQAASPPPDEQAGD